MIDLYKFERECEEYIKKKRLADEGIKFNIDIVPDNGPKIVGYDIIITMNEIILENSIGICKEIIHRTNDISSESFIDSINIILDKAEKDLKKYNRYEGPVTINHVYLYRPNTINGGPYTASELLDLITPYIDNSI